VKAHGQTTQKLMERMKNEMLELQRITTNVSPALIMRKFKVTAEVAEQLCLNLWHTNAKEWFYLRNFGVNTEDFHKGDFLNKPRNILEPK
jgi:hypothetical protein